MLYIIRQGWLNDQVGHYTPVIMFTILTTWRLPDKKSSAQFQIDLLSSRNYKASFDIFIVLKVELWTINQYTHPSKCMNSSRAVCKVGEVVSLISLFSLKLHRVQGFMNDAVSRGQKWPQFDSSYSGTDWNLRVGQRNLCADWIQMLWTGFEESWWDAIWLHYLLSPAKNLEHNLMFHRNHFVGLVRYHSWFMQFFFAWH